MIATYDGVILVVSKRQIVFLTGTRADFGKLKSLIAVAQASDEFETHVFATGMHMNSKYGKTVDEIFKAGFKNIFQFINHDTIDNMDRTLAKTIDGFTLYIKEIEPDLIVVHGDRVEALAGAITGSLNNILVAHVEGGEVSGTIDELIRHAVSKMSHIHFVANQKAKRRLVQLGELPDTVFVIGSPDLDLMNPRALPDLELVLAHYNIEFESYAIAMFHPVTTEYNEISEHTKEFVDALIESDKNYIVIYPNNDIGSTEIIRGLARLEGSSKFRLFPSLRFEYFLRLLHSADFIVGNSSAGVREAPHYAVPTVDIGTRQANRVSLPTVLHCGYSSNEILAAIEKVELIESDRNWENNNYFGEGNSDQLFIGLLNTDQIWGVSHQKQFQEIDL